MEIFEPSKMLLIKLGSIVVHSDELTSDTGHDFDVTVIKALLNDVEVIEWLKEMDKLALLPKKRF